MTEPNYRILWWNEILKDPPNLDKLAEYAQYVDVNEQYSKTDKDTPLLIAIQKKNIPFLKKLIELGVNINKRIPIGKFPKGQYPIIYACHINREVLNVLLEGGANVNIFDDLERTPLITVILNNNIEMVKDILAAGANVNFHHPSGTTALIAAVHSRNIEILKLILAKHPDINILPFTGGTALMRAVYYKDIEMVKLLLEAGADKMIKDDYGMTVLDYNTDPVIHNLLHPLDSIDLPVNAKNTIMFDTIVKGNTIVNFHDEKKYGRYYKKNTYNTYIKPSMQNPITRRAILDGNIHEYIVSGGKRKKHSRRTKFTRKLRRN